MTINNKINNLYIQAEDLFNALQNKNTISSSEALAYSAQLVKLRKLSDTLLKEQVLPSLNKSQYLQMGKCRKLIFKSQSKLFKKLDPSVLQSSGFHTKVCQVWAHAASKTAPSVDFGKKFAKMFPKDPITLEGLNNYLINITLKKYIRAIALKDTSYATQLLNKLPAETQKAFKQCFFQQVGKEKISDDELLQKAIAAAEKTLQIYDIPIIHNTIDQTSFMFLKLLNDNGKIREEFRKHMLNEAKIELSSREEIRDYLFLNAGHPYLAFALFSIQLSSNLKPAFTMLEKGDWLSGKTALRNLLDPAASVLVNCLAQIKKETASHALLETALNKNAPDPDLIEALKHAIEQFELNLKENVAVAPEKKDGQFMAVFTIQGSSDPKTTTCEQELRIAYEAMVYALRKIAISSNFFNREEKTVDIQSINEVTKFYEFLVKVRNQYGFSATKNYLQKKSSSNNHFTFSISNRKSVEEYPIGNCGELTQLAFEYLVRSNKDLKIEMVEIPQYQNYGNHGFLVINRDYNSKINDPTTWGNKAVILDCWTRMIYPAKESMNLLENWEETDNKTGFVTLKPYNYEKQYFNIHNQHVMLYQVYKKSNGPPLLNLEENLNAFHKATTVDDKMEFAKTALEVTEKEGANLTPIVHMLRTQLYFYLHSKLPPLVSSQSNPAPAIKSSSMKEEIKLPKKTNY